MVTHYATSGSGASRLDYVLSLSPQHVLPVAAAIHKEATWPYDHHPVLVDYWGLTPPPRTAAYRFRLKWKHFLQKSEEALSSPQSADQFRSTITASLPIDLPADGPGQDNVILRLEQWLQEAHHTRSAGPAPTLDRIRFCLDAIALALHGITGEVVARVVGRAPSGLQRPRRPPRAPSGSAWELVSLWTMGLRRAVAVSAAFAPPPSVSSSTETDVRDRQHIRSTFDEPCKALVSGRNELTAAPPELVLPDIPEQLPPPPPLDAPGQQWRTWWEGLNRLPAPTRGGGALHRLRASLPQVLHALQALNANRILHNRRASRRHHQLRTFFACLRPQGDRGGGLRPELFIEAATHYAPTSQRPCESQAERLEAVDQTFAWMHDEQPPFPLPRFLRKTTDSMPAPRQAPPRWVVDWEAWADLGGEGWGKLTLWDRRLAHAFLPPLQHGLPEFSPRRRKIGSSTPLQTVRLTQSASSNSAP